MESTKEIILGIVAIVGIFAACMSLYFAIKGVLLARSIERYNKIWDEMKHPT